MMRITGDAAGSVRSGMLGLMLLRPRMVLVLFCLAAWIPGLFVLPPADRDESRFAQATKQMIETGDYVRIMNGSEARNRKPIGIHWMQAPFVIAARAAGASTLNTIWPYRVPSLLGGIVAVLATYELGLILTGVMQTGLLAALMLAGCLILAVETHIAKTDAALLGATTVAMAMLARAWTGRDMQARDAAVFWLALGIGVLLKGPVTPMVVGLTILALPILPAGGSPDALIQRRPPLWAWLGRLRPGWGVPLLLAVILPWFVAIGIETNGAFFADAVGGDLGRKLAGGSEAHGGFPGLHLLLMPLLAFPSSPLVLCSLPAAWRRRREPVTWFLLAWLVPAWLIFEAVPTKLPHYTLPLYPALFLLAGSWISAGELRPAAPRIVLAARVATVAGAVMIGVMATALPVFLGSPWWLSVPAWAGCMLTGWAIWRTRPLVALLAAVGLYAALLQIDLPSIDALWLTKRVQAALVRDVAGFSPATTRLAVCGYAEPSLMFLAGTSLQLLYDGKACAAALESHRAEVVMVEGDSLAGFEASSERLHLRARRLEHLDGFNYSRGRRVSLTLFSR